MALELFHRIAEPDSAQVRRWLTAHDPDQRVALRNIFHPEARADFERRGGTLTPALWDGERLHSGFRATLAALARLLGAAGPGR